MRLLLLATRPPYPLTNGEDLRIYHLARHLKDRHEIHLLCFGRDVPPEVESFCTSIRLLPREDHAASRQNLLLRVLEGLSIRSYAPYDPRVPEVLRELLTHGAHDLLWVPAWEMVPYAFAVSGVPVVIDAMDDGVLESARALRHTREPTAALRNARSLWLHYWFERAYFPRAMACVVVAERDAQILRMICPRAHVSVIHNGVDVQYFHPSGEPEDPSSLIFEGNMNFAPSVDAAVHFCSRILPRVRSQHPDATFFLVGKDPAPAVRALAGPGVIVTGTVPDVRPYLSRSAIFVCPMRSGAGVKNKILQAWAMERPVVASPVACGGLTVNPGRNIIVARGPQEFADAIVRLLRDPALRRTIGIAARETVRRHYDWADKAREFESVLSRAISDARDPGS